MNILRTTLLMIALLTAPVTFSALARTEIAHISVPAVSGSPSVVEDTITKLAQEKNVTFRKATSMRINSNTHATATLYK